MGIQSTALSIASAARALARWFPWIFAVGLVGALSCSAPKRVSHEWASVRQEAAASERTERTVQAIEAGAFVLMDSYEVGDGAEVGVGFDLSLRNPDFPQTYVEAVHVSVTGPEHWVSVEWTGPLAHEGPTGPWRSTPGRGKPDIDCDDPVTSNQLDSFCTPKGVFPVAGFADRLGSVPTCHYATWVVHAPRYIALHSHTDLPSSAASSGCVRMPFEAAKLIHNNSRVGLTLIDIGGTWTRPPAPAYLEGPQIFAGAPAERGGWENRGPANLDSSAGGETDPDPERP